MRTLIHITDLHFGKLTSGSVERLEDQIGQLRPDMCIVSGDLTMRSRPREWEQARAFLDRLPSPYMVVPGNHDLPYVNLYERFRHPYKRFQKYISEDLNPRHTDDMMAIMGINTARPWVPHYTWKEGGISPGQVEAAETFFKNDGNRRFKVVFTHHPFLPPPEKPRTYLVRNAPAALKAFEKADVDLLLGGHLHLNYNGDIPSFYKSIKKKMICLQGGTATSSRLRNGVPNGYSRIMTDGKRLSAITMQWTGEDYAALKTVEYRRGTAGWENTGQKQR